MVFIVWSCAFTNSQTKDWRIYMAMVALPIFSNSGQFMKRSKRFATVRNNRLPANAPIKRTAYIWYTTAGASNADHGVRYTYHMSSYMQNIAAETIRETMKVDFFLKRLSYR